ncbi:hypothetical protein E2562_035017 [Oryza meyeriana var. granulata]|uniref:Uncharacterized protein n=1 Tax=Oryza meyeriana var. granulata TaxID=110450 RepID=A0A6G1F1K5_9ORYZ|nr:hypothetical protein E2562_035017 [Oryza meyeriana var. granulata]
MLQFEVKAQVPLLGNKLVGKVSVPLADLAGGGDGVAPRHVSYQVCAPDDKANGKLNFTYSVTGGGDGAYQQPQPALNGTRPEQDPTSCYAPPPSGVPHPSPALASYPPLPSLSAPLYPPPPRREGGIGTNKGPYRSASRGN